MSSNKIDTVPQITNKYVTGEEKVTTEGVDYSRIFADEFKNGETALDEMNMNTLLYAIEKNNLNINSIINYLNERINTINGNFTSIDVTIKNLDSGYATDTELSTLETMLGIKINEINSALNNLADKDVTTLPSISFKSSNISAVEVGTKISPSYELEFNSGTYEYGPTPTGSTAEKYTVKFNGETKTTASGTFKEITVGEDNSLKLTATCGYTQGDIPKNNLGLDYEDGRINKGTTKEISKTLSGYRQVFFGSTTSSFTLNSATIRGLALKTHTKSTASSFTMSVVEGAKQVLIAVPSNRKLTAIEDKNAFGTDILVKFATEKLDIGGADATETDIGDYAKDYTLYIYSPDAALSANTYTVKLTNT